MFLQRKRKPGQYQANPEAYTSHDRLSKKFKSNATELKFRKSISPSSDDENTDFCLRNGNEVVQKRIISHDPSLESIPTEVFCYILSFLGPRSMELVTLSEVNVRFNKVMGDIGDAMVTRAEAVFRGNVQSRDICMSSISKFVKLSRECYDVQQQISSLSKIVKKNFCRQPGRGRINEALDLCLNLLNKRCSKHQERQLVALCGKCSGKAYKLSRHDSLKTSSANVDCDAFKKKACLVMTIVAIRKMKMTEIPPR